MTYTQLLSRISPYYRRHQVGEVTLYRSYIVYFNKGLYVRDEEV